MMLNVYIKRLVIQRLVEGTSVANDPSDSERS